MNFIYPINNTNNSKTKNQFMFYRLFTATIFTFVTFLFYSNNLVFACQEQLSNIFSADSVSHYVNVDDLDYTYKCTSNNNCINPFSDRLFAMNAIKKLMTTKNCSKIEIDNIVFKHTECHRFSKKDLKHLVCYIKTSFGFFYFTRDFVDGAQIIYNRWD
ncbi:MAG: hypothetical protein HQK51_15290 [Oligoflexia bacterium]|nr:hypothetical protein [Oligoflexia bacterium]